MTQGRFSEAEIGAAAQQYLAARGWDTYPEVAVRGVRADLVGRRGPVLWVVECKTSPSLKLLEQAFRWVGHAHYISVVTDRPCSAFLKRLLREKGVGSHRVTQGYDRAQHRVVAEISDLEWLWGKPCLFRRPDCTDLIKALHPDQKNYRPGTQAGFSSPWRRTMEASVDLIRRAPGVSTRTIVEKIDHHYHTDKSAVRNIISWLHADERVVARKENRQIVWYPATAEAVVKEMVV